ncbi:hypothetical protein LINPERPRIM_LOCUS24251 [Linum perenne]
MVFRFLPLSIGPGLRSILKVIGSLLFRWEKQFRIEKFIELKEVSATNNKVQQRLKISYNELTNKHVLLHFDYRVARCVQSQVSAVFKSQQMHTVEESEWRN